MKPLDGSVEFGYRMYHDSFGIFSHTVSLSWFQKLGKRVVLSPMFRFTDQSAADFYAQQLPGDPSCSSSDPFCSTVKIPRSYSADYRLSALQTFTCGIGATAKILDRVSLDFGYKRYVMVGTDHVTSASAYPSADNISAGFRLWF